MKLIGRHPTEKELDSMKAPFKTNTGKAWTVKLMCKCINKGADVAAQNPEIQQALKNGIKLLSGADNQGK
ncbi:MAG: hypothetical protein K2N07_04720 [Desulfovibrio sp.]|nr:hypothetical protein [Desulfovibrio sp.]